MTDVYSVQKRRPEFEERNERGLQKMKAKMTMKTMTNPLFDFLETISKL